MAVKRYIKICNAFNTAHAVNMGTQLEIFRGKAHDYDYIELENGIWLKGYRDGRYTSATEGCESERWAVVQILEENEDGDILSGEVLGFTRL